MEKVNDYASNVITFGVDSSSSSHIDNQNMMKDERYIFGINGKFGAPEKNLALILVNQEQSFA